ncbi:MAG: hypothetical protein V1668_03420 [Patescibacteria group bacterium]
MESRQTIDPRKIKNQPFTMLSWLHLVAIMLIWASPFLFSWWLIVIGIFMYFLQILFLGDCFLTRRQFLTKKRSVTFYYYVLVKFGFTPNGYRIRFAADYIMPPVILGWAMAWQLMFDKKTLLF